VGIERNRPLINELAQSVGHAIGISRTLVRNSICKEKHNSLIWECHRNRGETCIAAYIHFPRISPEEIVVTPPIVSKS